MKPTASRSDYFGIVQQIYTYDLKMQNKAF
nr:MAG TPA: hypothetical protein [Caudoviricetes sp.]